MVTEKRIYKTLKIRTSANRVSGSGRMLSYKNNKGIFSVELPSFTWKTE